MKMKLLAAVAIFGFTALTTRGATLIVDDNGQCPGATFVSIQAAVLAANPGDTINVCPGVYNEQVVINKELKIEGIPFGNEAQAAIRPAAVAPNSTTLFSGAAIAAIVLVDGVEDVELINLTVDGENNDINGCEPVFVGVYYRNASGQMEFMTVRNIKLGPGLEGCQSGVGVFAESGAGGVAKLEVNGSSVHDYQKNGLTANEAQTELKATKNAISGFGPSQHIAQNGIQIGFGAKGELEENAVINHIFAPCTDVESCGAAGTNILIVEAGEVKVKKNTLGKAQINLYLGTNSGEAKENTIFDTDVFDGIAVLGNNNKVEKNSIFNSDEAAVYVEGHGNKVQGNVLNEAPIGVFNGGTSNDVTKNEFFNIVMKVAGPATAPAASTRRPQARTVNRARSAVSPMR